MNSVPVEVWVSAVVFIVVGACLVGFAPHIQRANLRLIGAPRGGLAGWSYRMAASKTSLYSIRLSGAICLAMGAAILGFVARR